MRTRGLGVPSPRASQKQPDLGFLLGEFIGRRIRVAKSSCKGLQGIEGIVADEGRNSFLLHTGRGSKRIPKMGCTFVFPGLSDQEVQGKTLAIRPEDRTKKLAQFVLKN